MHFTLFLPGFLTQQSTKCRKIKPAAYLRSHVSTFFKKIYKINNKSKHVYTHTPTISAIPSAVKYKQSLQVGLNVGSSVEPYAQISGSFAKIVHWLVCTRSSKCKWPVSSGKSIFKMSKTDYTYLRELKFRPAKGENIAKLCVAVTYADYRILAAVMHLTSGGKWLGY